MLFDIRYFTTIISIYVIIMSILMKEYAGKYEVKKGKRIYMSTWIHIHDYYKIIIVSETSTISLRQQLSWLPLTHRND